MDRGKPGAKLHVLTDAQGLPLVTAVSAANIHDSLALKSLVTRVFNYRCLTVRYERKSRHFAAFLSLAAILVAPPLSEQVGLVRLLVEVLRNLRTDYGALPSCCLLLSQVLTLLPAS